MLNHSGMFEFFTSLVALVILSLGKDAMLMVYQLMLVNTLCIPPYQGLHAI